MNLTSEFELPVPVGPHYGQPKDTKVKLMMEVGKRAGITLVRCNGRITYRYEAAALSQRVIELLPHARHLVLDLSAVERIDSAGLGELVVLFMRARASQCTFKLASPRPEILELLQITNLISIIDVKTTVDEALASCREQAA